MAAFKTHHRPWGISALSIFFGAGTLISATSALSLLIPGGMLEPMWQLNPKAQQAFLGMGWVAVPLLGVVSLCCLLAAIGFWRGTRWGYWVGVGLLSVNLLGDLTSTLLRIEPRAVVGIPIVALLLFYLASRGVRRFFMSQVVG